MTSLIEPNLHPILVHFAFALSITAVLSYWLSSLLETRRESLVNAADWMLGFAAFSIILTILAGFQAYYSVGHDGPSHEAMTTHRNWAVPSGIAILLLALWRWSGRHRAPKILFKSLMTLAAFSLSVTAWWGGHIVYNYGLGVKSLPAVSGDGHDHDHGDADQAASAHDMEDGHHDDSAGDHYAGVENSEGDPGKDNDPAPSLDEPVDPDSPAAIVEGFARALKAGDRAALEAMIMPDVVIAEGGAPERSFNQYAGHHMNSDMAFMAAVETTLKKRDVLAGDKHATVISELQIHGDYKGQKVHSRMMETMTLVKKDNRWMVQHIHWSSSPITGAHEH